jgi:type IV secretion system protein VirD4
MSFGKKFSDLEMWVEDKRDEFEAWLKKIFSRSAKDNTQTKQEPPRYNKEPEEHTEPTVEKESVPEPKKSAHVKPSEMAELLRFKPNPEARNRWMLYIVGVVLTAVTLSGALLGYVRGYNRFMKDRGEFPGLYPLKPIVRRAMWMGAILLPLFILLIGYLLFRILRILPYYQIQLLIYWIVGNLVTSLIVFAQFRRWQNAITNTLIESRKFGSARFAYEEELDEYHAPEGFYVGGGYTFWDKGHILTMAGTRAGKGTNLIIPNLLGKGNYQGSWVVIDPKGENAAITGRYQRETGRNVVVLNPWGLLTKEVGEAQSYNPLDILSDITSVHLVDDAQIIAEMLVPVVQNDHNKYFTDNARSIVTGLIMQIVTTQEGDDKTLTTLWRWARYSGDDWDGLIALMRRSKDPANGLIIRTIGNEIVKLMETGEETFGSIISNVLQATDFIKSPALQQSLRSGYDPASLSEGKTALYIIIPADKLQSHSRWLRLIVTTTLRSVIRKPNKRVAFLLDEFAALGYLSEIETALSTYAGYEVTIWPILQSLIQLKGLYGDNWETFIANTAIRQYFAVNDNFSAEYVSGALGETSHVVSNKGWFGGEGAESNHRALVTPDEVRRGSANAIFGFFASNPPTVFKKAPYYEMGTLKGRDDPNPYLRN